MRTLLRFALIVCSLSVCADTVFACMCAVGSVAERRKHAQAVFVGKVVEQGVEYIPDRHTPPGEAGRKGSGGAVKLLELPRGQAIYRTKFAVERSWKSAEVEEITVYTRGGCMVSFRQGEKHLVFAYVDKDSGRLETSICTGTRDVRHAGEDLKKLGKGKVIKPKERAVVTSKGEHNNGMHPTPLRDATHARYAGCG